MALFGPRIRRENCAMEEGELAHPGATAVKSTGSRERACRVRGPGEALARRLEREHGTGALHRDPEYIERTRGMVYAYTRYFSPEVRGLEHLPADGPVLVVGNHCGLFYMPEVWVTALSIIDRRGTEHPAYSLTYDLLFALPVIGPFLRRIGALPASSVEAETALDAGALVLDYPGGDWEACRPWLDRNTIDFGGRTGFVRLALRTGVPVVPVVAHGSHDSVIVLSRGEAIARALGLGASHIKVFPILLGPFGLTTALTPPPPLPSSVTVEFLPAIEWSDLGPETAEDAAVVDRCSTEVVETMQNALNRLRVERAHPVRRGLVSLVSRALPH
jgi:1-acyl-sn-glycerol-3-phosphate acyltransferase